VESERHAGDDGGSQAVIVERRAGRGIASDGTLVVWTIARGRRGTRWRSMRTDDRGVVSALTMETAPDDRLGRLELATDRGMLTAHPDALGTALHGNVVTASGVRHLTLAWSPEHVLLVDDEPLALEAVVPHLAEAARRAVSASVDRPVVRLDRRLEPETGRLLVEIEPNGSIVSRDSLTGESVRLAGPPSGRPLAELAEPGVWPLELE
jgi:hypothetical protein